MRVPYLKTIVAASLLCAGVALAQGPGFGPGFGGPGAGYGPGMMGGPGLGYGPGRMGGGYGPGMGGYGARGFGQDALASLNLTDEQRDKILAIREEHRQKNWSAMGKVRDEMFKSRLEMHKQIESILTPEQRKQFRGFGPRWAG